MKEPETLIQEDTNWQVTDTRYVAYIDIMGFKDMVARSTHDEIYELMKKIDDKKKLNESIDWGKYAKRLVRTTTYSDSIMIYSKDEKYESFYSFVCTVSALTNDLFCEMIPHKGAIAFGTMTLDTEKSIFFGQPLIDAYLLQEELNFYGIVVHATAEQELIKQTERPFIKNHLCPFKNGSAWSLTVQPIFANTGSSDDHLLREKYKQLHESVKKLRFKTSGHLRKYIDNTESYFDLITKL